MVEQVNTQVKKLRERAENISHTQQQPGYCPATPGSLLTQPLHGDGRLLRMQSRLKEALAVIEEQDRLIHQGCGLYMHLHNSSFILSTTALLGRLQPDFSNMKDEVNSNADNMEGDNSPILSTITDRVPSDVDEYQLLDFDVLPPGTLTLK